jgi:SAM-dependent methyltransferase
LDLGCNYGYYSFLVKRLGAEFVVGVDSDANAIDGCRLLAGLYRFSGMEFLARDFTGLALPSGFDSILLINFIGKKSLVRGIQPVLDICRRYARESVIISARCRYHIRRSLKVDPGQMRAKYGEQYVQGEWFDTELFLQNYLAADLVQLSPDYEDTTLKRTFLFRLF